MATWIMANSLIGTIYTKILGNMLKGFVWLVLFRPLALYFFLRINLLCKSTEDLPNRAKELI
jgi:hypothetical protein